MSDSVLKKLSDKLMEWDQQLASLKQQATSSAGAQKQNIDKLSADLSAQTAALKAKID